MAVADYPNQIESLLRKLEAADQAVRRQHPVDLQGLEEQTAALCACAEDLAIAERPILRDRLQEVVERLDRLGEALQYYAMPAAHRPPEKAP